MIYVIYILGDPYFPQNKLCCLIPDLDLWGKSTTKIYPTKVFLKTIGKIFSELRLSKIKIKKDGENILFFLI